MLRFLRIAGIVVTTLVLAAALPVNNEKPKRGVIPTGEFHRIERAGRDAGFAEACQVEWNQFHTAFMKKEGRKRWTRRHLPITQMSPAGALKKLSVLIRLLNKKGFQAACLMRPGNTCQMLYSQLGNHCDSVAQSVKEMDKVQI
jgi:hypothetical protein